MSGTIIPFKTRARHGRASNGSTSSGKQSSAVTNPSVAALIARASGAFNQVFRLRNLSTVVRSHETPCSRIRAAMDSSSKARAVMKSASCMGDNVHNTHIPVKGKCASHAVELSVVSVHSAHMMAKAKKARKRKVTKAPPQYRVTRMREWREHAGLTQEQAGDLIGKSHSQLGRIENGHQPYNQEFLEALAKIYKCTPSDLIDRLPGEKGADSKWEKLSAEQRARALRLLDAAEGEHTAIHRGQSAA